ncbi:hypothetical protein M087_1926 [Bacteroides fragilis str. S23 R14]|nr:hypothetical protein M087_1926 [Bacteroides fragilis str. S23 R14]
MWLAISAICSVNAMYAELSIVITSIRSIFLLFLRQSSAIGKGGFNNSLRDSRKIFWKLSPLSGQSTQQTASQQLTAHKCHVVYYFCPNSGRSDKNVAIGAELCNHQIFK